jgi:CBS domain
VFLSGGSRLSDKFMRRTTLYFNETRTRWEWPSSYCPHEAKKDLNRLTAGDVMAKDHISVTEDTSIDEAVKIMEEKRLLNLPVKINGTVAYSITRHDLLRAWIGLGVDIETNSAP